jgi:hypothetical protein
MNSKMCGFSVAWLIFICFLSLSCSPTPSVSSREGFPVRGPLGEQSGTSEPGSTRRGNCLQVTGTKQGTPFSYCYYTSQNPICTTTPTDCRNITGVCVVGSTPNPPQSC